MVIEDLASWLTQIWDEQEALARAAYYEGQNWLPEEEAVVEAADWDVVHMADRKVDARHIAEWQPSAVLARIAADRQILALHSGAAGLCSWSQDGNDTHDADDPCTTLRLLALPYADRPGYREEWRP